MITAMTALERGRLGRNHTDLPSIRAVRDTVRRLVRRHWGGRSAADQEDLESLVLEKYFRAFGRERLPEDDAGDPRVPLAWLSKVVRTTGIDLHRQDLVRPFDPMDFADADDANLERRLFDAVRDNRRLSAAVADRADMRRALTALADAFPRDVQLIRWRIVDDKTIEDVADLAHMTPDAARKAVQRALTKLRVLLATTAPSTGARLNKRAATKRVTRRG